MTDKEYKEYLEDRKDALNDEYEEIFKDIQMFRRYNQPGITLQQKMDVLLAHYIRCLERDLEDVMSESAEILNDKGELAEELDGDEDDEGFEEEGDDDFPEKPTPKPHPRRGPDDPGRN